MPGGSSSTASSSVAAANTAHPETPKTIMSFLRSKRSCTMPPGRRNRPLQKSMTAFSVVAKTVDPVTVCAMIGSAKSWMLFETEVQVSATNHWP